MKALLDLVCQDLSDTPPQVRDAMKRLQIQFSEPAKPLMTQEAFEKLPYFKQCILTCNTPGCGNVVSTHGLLCVSHLGS